MPFSIPRLRHSTVILSSFCRIGLTNRCRRQPTQSDASTNPVDVAALTRVGGAGVDGHGV